MGVCMLVKGIRMNKRAAAESNEAIDDGGSADEDISMIDLL